MANFPVEATLFDINIKGDDANPLVKNWYRLSKELQGALPPQTNVILNDNISLVDGTSAYIIVDTEAGSPVDNLSTIAGTFHDGALIRLRSANTSRIVTLKNNASAGGIMIGADTQLVTDAYIELKKQGNNWVSEKNADLKSVYDTAALAKEASSKIRTQITDNPNLWASVTGMPSTKYIDINSSSFPNGGLYTAPANGWFFYGQATTAIGQILCISNNTAKLISQTTCALTGAVYACYVPAQKNDVIQNGGTMQGAVYHCRFIYAEGAK